LYNIANVGGCHRRSEPELTGERSFRPLQNVPPPSSLTILGRRLELEAYTCGALYVGLGGEKGLERTGGRLLLPGIRKPT
jgi:hypothetical protein